MSFALTEDHRLLADTARAVLLRHGGVTSAREATDTHVDKLPTSWKEIVGLGWLGLAVPEAWAGQGYSMEELAVVVFEMGRSVVAGPFLPTVWAAAILTRCGDENKHGERLADLATGRRCGAVGLSRDGVLGGGWAELFLLIEGSDVLVFDRSGGMEVSVLESLDRTRPLARISHCGTPIDRIAGAAPAALALGRMLAAVEAAGVASACLDAATSYAKEREQFGRVIGSFQAVKHHLANMLVDTELVTAAAWDAARAASGAPQDTSADEQLWLAAAIAATEGMDGAVRVALKNIQVHGGIGFTWEHDAHIYVRRATSLRAIFASERDPALEVTTMVRSGTRRDETIELPAEAEEFRAEAVKFKRHLLSRPKEQRRDELVAEGYLVPHWPRPWGRGAGPVEQLVVDDVLADVERPDLGIGGWVTLTITQHGTEDQRRRWVLPSLRGELVF
ncbi:MAG TPA: acyl-CoA dehydrogenase, partial [Acidimicrobiales bacterium]